MKQEDFVKNLKKQLETAERKQAMLRSEINTLKKLISRGEGRPS